MTKINVEKRVTEQQLDAPVLWGSFATSKVPVSLIAPPLEVLHASFSDPVKPTEIAYIMVVGNNTRKPGQKKQEPVAADEVTTGKPKFKLLVDDEELSKKLRRPLNPSSTYHDIVQPKFELILEGKYAKDEELPTICSLSSLSSIASLGDESGQHDEVTITSSITSHSFADSSTQQSGSTSDLSSLSAAEALIQRETAVLLQKLADSERRQKMLEQQLRQSGVCAVTDDIPYHIAKAKVDDITSRLNVIGDTYNEEYYNLERELEHFSAAMMLTDEWQQEQEKAEQNWELDNKAENWMALQQLRRHMPVNVRRMTTCELAATLPMDLVKRFKRTDVLTLLRMDPGEIERMHPSMLENMHVTGLTLTERRALHAHLSGVAVKWKPLRTDVMTGRKYSWFTMMKENFQESLNKYQFHVLNFGAPGCHCCSFVGRSCPVAANAYPDYSGSDYGFPVSDEYETTCSGA